VVIWTTLQRRKAATKIITQNRTVLTVEFTYRLLKLLYYFCE